MPSPHQDKDTTMSTSILTSPTTIPVPLNSATIHTTLGAALSLSTTPLSDLKQIHAQILRSNLPPSLLFFTLFLFSRLRALRLHPPLHILPLPIQQTLAFFVSQRQTRNYLFSLSENKVRGRVVGVDRFSFPPLLKAVTRVSGSNDGRGNPWSCC